VCREDCFRFKFKKLIVWLHSSVMPWSVWRQGACVLVGEPRRGHPFHDRRSRCTRQQHVFRFDNVDTGRRYALMHLQVIRNLRHQFVGAASTTTSSSAVIEPGPAWSPGP
jgi:hypothetical protein